MKEEIPKKFKTGESEGKLKNELKKEFKEESNRGIGEGMKGVEERIGE